MTQVVARRALSYSSLREYALLWSWLSSLIGMVWPVNLSYRAPDEVVAVWMINLDDFICI